MYDIRCTLENHSVRISYLYMGKVPITEALSSHTLLLKVIAGEFSRILSPRLALVLWGNSC